MLFLVTLNTGGLGLFIGIITAGIGALVTFKTADRFIKKIIYKRGEIFLLGSLPFIILCILFISPITELIKPIYDLKVGINTMFAPIYLFWQTIVGTKLALQLER